MDATRLLEEQHDAVAGLFEKYDKAEDPDLKQALFQEIADHLAAHATIEEKIFYPAAYVGETKDLLKEAVEEHLGIKRIIADLLAMTPADENFDAKVKVLKEQVEHHVEEEETELFKEVRKELGKDELQELGVKMESMFNELLPTTPSADVPDQTDEAAPLE